MKRPPLELFWYWCEQKKHYGFSSKNFYLLLVSVRAWFSSKISDDYPRTPLTVYVGIFHTSIPGRKNYPRCFACQWSLLHELLLNFLAMCCSISFL